MGMRRRSPEREARWEDGCERDGAQRGGRRRAAGRGAGRRVNGTEGVHVTATSSGRPSSGGSGASQRGRRRDARATTPSAGVTPADGTGAAGRRGEAGNGPMGRHEAGNGPMGRGEAGNGPTVRGESGTGPTGSGESGIDVAGNGPMGTGVAGNGPMGRGKSRTGPTVRGESGTGPMGRGESGIGVAGNGPMGREESGTGPIGRGEARTGPIGGGEAGTGPMGTYPMWKLRGSKAISGGRGITVLSSPEQPTLSAVGAGADHRQGTASQSTPPRRLAFEACEDSAATAQLTGASSKEHADITRDTLTKGDVDGSIGCDVHADSSREVAAVDSARIIAADSVKSVQVTDIDDTAICDLTTDHDAIQNACEATHTDRAVHVDACSAPWAAQPASGLDGRAADVAVNGVTATACSTTAVQTLAHSASSDEPHAFDDTSALSDEQRDSDVIIESSSEEDIGDTL